MQKKKQKILTTYPPEFKAEAVKLVLEQNLTIREAPERLNMPLKTLSAWVIRARAGQLSISQQASTHDAEITRLKKALSIAEMERDILKKATAYFVKESQRGTRS